DLITHPGLDVFALVSGHAFKPELFAKFPGKIDVAGNKPRLEHGGFCQHITIGMPYRLFDRACGMTDLEAAVPKQVEQLLNHFLKIQRDFLTALPVQEHHIDVAKWIELASAV